LKQEDQYADNKAYRVAAVRSKVESEREIDKGSYDRLGDVICKAHPAVKAQTSNFITELFALIKEYKGCYEH